MRFVEFLLAARALVDQANNNGCTPLFCAAPNGHEKCVALLLRAAETLGECGGEGTPSRWLRVLHYTEGAAAGRLAVPAFAKDLHCCHGVEIEPGPTGRVYHRDHFTH